MAKDKREFYFSNLHSDMIVEILRPSEFLRLLGDNPIVYYDNQRFFFFHEGTPHVTNRLELEFNEFERLVALGMGDGDQWENVRIHSGEGFTRDSFNLVFQAENQRIGFSFGTPQWIVRTDFQNEGDFQRASEEGYLSFKDMEAGHKQGYTDGPCYYFARGNGFENQKEVELALKYGTDDRGVLLRLLKGGFLTLTDANSAWEVGFEDHETWQEAIALGCHNMEEYTAVKEHDWPSLDAFREAETLGFESDEKDLYVMVSTKPELQFVWNGIHETGPPWVKYARHNMNLIDLQVKLNLELPWQAFLLDYVIKMAPGDLISLDDVYDLVAENYEEGFSMGRCPASGVVEQFLSHDERAHRFGTVSTADRRFMRRKNDFKKSDD